VAKVLLLAFFSRGVTGWRFNPLPPWMGNEMKQPCPYCHQLFHPSPYRRDQRVCSRPECQARRRREYHRRKLATDEEYRQTCRDSQRKWREAHPVYLRDYRRAHSEQVIRNRVCQRGRDLRRQLGGRGRPALAMTVQPGPFWLLGPPGGHLAKNTLAFSQLIVVSRLARSQENVHLEKNNLACAQVTGAARDPETTPPLGPS
jgi:hypothetical protein